MQSILITGGDLKKRKAEAVVKLSNCQIASVDRLIIESNNSIGIDKIRDLEQWVSRKPYSGKLKAAIIFEAEKLTQEAQNALLKTLEEPPKNTLIILTAPQEELLLPTVVSRCKIVKLKPEAEIKLDKKNFNFQFSIFNFLLRARVGERLLKAQEIAKTREETIAFLDRFIFFLRQLLLEKLTRWEEQKHTGSGWILSPEVEKLTGRKIAQIIRGAIKTKEMVEKNVNFRLALENFFLNL